MRVDEIKDLEKGKKQIFFEDGFYLVLYAKEIRKFGFEENGEIDEDVIEEASKQLIIRGKKRVYHLLAKKDYTVGEIETKLSKSLYHPRLIDIIIAYFVEMKFLDDASYLQKYVACYETTRSHRMMRQKLKEKGIDDTLLRNYFATEVDKAQEYETATSLLEKKYRRRKVEKEDYKKMSQFLAYKGFDYEVIRSVVNELIKNSED